MRKIPSVIALGAAFAFILSAQPAAAQYRSGATPDQSQATKKKKAVTQTRVSPSGNPEWDVYVRGEYVGSDPDVYVRGEYVGSDPDPRIRSTIRREAVRNYGMR